MTDRAQTSDSRKLMQSKYLQTKHYHLAKNLRNVNIACKYNWDFLLGANMLGTFSGRSQSSSHEAMKGLQWYVSFNRILK